MVNIRVKQFSKIFLNCVRDVDISGTSVMIAYYLLLSLFPLILTIGTLLPYFHIQPDGLSPYLKLIMPSPILDVIEPMIANLLTSPNGGLLSLGIIGTIWSASKGMSHVQQGVDRAYGNKRTSYYISTRIASVGAMIIIILLLVAMMLLFSLGETLLERLAEFVEWAPRIGGYLRAWKWPTTFVALMIVFTAIYKLTPSVKLRIKDVLAGALLVSASLVVLVELFALYLSFSSRMFAAYGLFGSFFMLILWLRIVGVILLLGAALNASLLALRRIKPVPKASRIDAWIRKIWCRIKGVHRSK